MLDKLAEYASLIREWAPRVNLVSMADLDQLEMRHIEDSLRVADLVKQLPEGHAVDVGSGAGLPGIPLAIADPRREWRLLEPRAKRAAFLEEVVRQLSLRNCEVFKMTAEEAGEREGLAASHIVATARAVAAPPKAFRLIEPLLAPGGRALLFVSPETKIDPHAEETLPGIVSIVCKS